MIIRFKPIFGFITFGCAVSSLVMSTLNTIYKTQDSDLSKTLNVINDDLEDIKENIREGKNISNTQQVLINENTIALADYEKNIKKNEDQIEKLNSINSYLGRLETIERNVSDVKKSLSTLSETNKSLKDLTDLYKNKLEEFKNVYESIKKLPKFNNMDWVKNRFEELNRDSITNIGNLQHSIEKLNQAVSEIKRAIKPQEPKK